MLRSFFGVRIRAAAMLGLAAGMLPGLARAGAYYAPLVQCSAVTVPAKIAQCGSDPISSGAVAIGNDGETTVTVTGAAANTTYLIKFAAPDNSQFAAIGQLITNSKGNGNFDKPAVFPLNTVGGGNVVLVSGSGNSSGMIEFYGGIAVEASGGTHARSDFHPALVPCGAVKVPSSPSACGTDPLSSGNIDAEADNGDVDVTIMGAAKSATYAVVLRAINGTNQSLGNVTTDGSGNAQQVFASVFPAGTTGEGIFALRSSNVDQFISGFKITQKPPKPAQAHANLVRCVDVGNPVLTNCGTDPLASGALGVGSNGGIGLTLTGAQPSTNYEVFFRPLDNSGDQDTGIKVSTDTNGNGKGSGTFFKSGTLYSGTFVVEDKPVANGNFVDQFVPGLKSSK